MATSSIRLLTERASRLENSRKRARMEQKQMTERLTAGAASLAGAGFAGYFDGRFDVTKYDPEQGDGVTVWGLPAMVLVSAVTVGGGLYMGGTVGNVLTGFGQGVACGVVYNKMMREGYEAAQKAGEKE